MHSSKKMNSGEYSQKLAARHLCPAYLISNQQIRLDIPWKLYIGSDITRLPFDEQIDSYKSLEIWLNLAGHIFQIIWSARYELSYHPNVQNSNNYNQ